MESRPWDAPTTSLETGLLNVSSTALYISIPTYATSGEPRSADQIERIPVATSYGLVLQYIANGADAEFFLESGSYLELTFRLANVPGPRARPARVANVD